MVLLSVDARCGPGGLQPPGLHAVPRVLPAVGPATRNEVTTVSVRPRRSRCTATGETLQVVDDSATALRRFDDQRLRIGNNPTVHAVRSEVSRAGAESPGPACRSGYAGSDLSVLIPTSEAITCRRPACARIAAGQEALVFEMPPVFQQRMQLEWPQAS